MEFMPKSGPTLNIFLRGVKPAIENPIFKLAITKSGLNYNYLERVNLTTKTN